MWAEVECFQGHNFRQLEILIFKSPMLICFQVKSVPNDSPKNLKDTYNILSDQHVDQ